MGGGGGGSGTPSVGRHGNSSHGKHLRVRFRLDDSTTSLPSLVFAPNDPIIVRWKSLCIVFLTTSFFRLPMIIAYGKESIVWDAIPDVYFALDHLLVLNTGM